MSANLFGCATARNKGTCDNRLNIRTDTLEDIVLAGLKHRLMAPEIFKEFAAAFIAEHNTIISPAECAFRGGQIRTRPRSGRGKRLSVNALADGVAGAHGSKMR